MICQSWQDSKWGTQALQPELIPTDFIRIDEAPVPEGGEVFFLPTADGARLRVAVFATEGAKASVMLLTGWSEFIEKYMEVVADLKSRGFNVVVMDWRGQGLSSRLLPAVPEKGHILSFGTHEGDLKYVVENVLTRRFEGPYFLMAHSMGGAISLLLLSDGYDKFDGAILSSPMTRIFPEFFKRNLVRLLARLGTFIGLERAAIPFVREHARKFEGNNLTHDETRHTMYRKLLEAAPNAALHGPTFGWLNAAAEAVTKLDRQSTLDGIRSPVKIVAAGNDHTVDGPNASTLARRCGAVDITVVKGAYHELLMEEDQYRDQFWHEFDLFMEQHLGVE